MRKRLAMAIIGLAALIGAGAASAQVKIQVYTPNMAPKAVRNAPKPVMQVVPPSVAMRQALAIKPNAKALGVKLKGPLYIVKLKDGNKITQVRVNARTGLVAP